MGRPRPRSPAMMGCLKIHCASRFVISVSPRREPALGFWDGEGVDRRWEPETGRRPFAAVCGAHVATLSVTHRGRRLSILLRDLPPPGRTDTERCSCTCAVACGRLRRGPHSTSFLGLSGPQPEAPSKRRSWADRESVREKHFAIGHERAVDRQLAPWFCIRALWSTARDGPADVGANKPH